MTVKHLLWLFYVHAIHSISTTVIFSHFCLSHMDSLFSYSCSYNSQDITAEPQSHSSKNCWTLAHSIPISLLFSSSFLSYFYYIKSKGSRKLRSKTYSRNMQ